MLRNYLATGWRNLVRNRLYAAVTIMGLAIGFAAAILIALYVRDELSFDRFVPDAAHVARLSETVTMPGAKPLEMDVTPPMMAHLLREEFPQIEATARLSPSFFPPNVRHGQITAAEPAFFWGDPDFFRILPFPVVAGDLKGALEAPDAVVLTRHIARKYFGRDAPVGAALTVDGHPMRVAAVIEDLPSNTHLTADIIGSTRASFSPLSRFEATSGPLSNTVATYVRFRNGAHPQSIADQLDRFLREDLPLPAALQPSGPIKRKLTLVPLRQIHLRASDVGAFRPATKEGAVLAIGAIGALIVAVAAINFVVLMTARGSRRAMEIGVRKAAGARRRDLLLQFLGEALLQVLLGGLAALALGWILLPGFNALMQKRLTFDVISNPGLALAFVAVLLLVGALAGAYPAMVVAAFPASKALKGDSSVGAGGARLRQVLVVAQFAVLIVLTLGATTIARQTLFALKEGTRVNIDQVLLVFSSPCSEVMRDEARRIPGVTASSCMSTGSLNLTDSRVAMQSGDRHADIRVAGLDYGFLELFGVHPLAGRLFDHSRAADGPASGPDHLPPVVLNLSAAQRLGYNDPAQAIGKVVNWTGIDTATAASDAPAPPARPSEIIGVTPDFTFGSMQQPITATAFAIATNTGPASIGLAVRLDPARAATALPAIDKLWSRVSGGEPILKAYAGLYLLRLYVETIAQGVAVAMSAVVALSIACLGLFALSAHATERRIKEIGIRKAMGASTGSILRLLMWQFSKPILWATLIAWPSAFLILDWWLKGFTYRVDLSPWTFVAATAGAFLIAWATVFGHSFAVARAKPAGALRYE